MVLHKKSIFMVVGVFCLFIKATLKILLKGQLDSMVSSLAVKSEVVGSHQPLCIEQG